MTISTMPDNATVLRGEKASGDLIEETARIRRNERETENERLDGKQKEQPEFLVKYRNRVYDIGDFFRHHPGGRRVLGNLRNRSLDKALEENPHSKSAFHLLKECTLEDEKTEQDIESAVNWNAPILDQVGKLADRYWEWVNLPVNRDIRIFHSDLMERLSITPWYLIPIVWIPLCAYFLYLGCLNVLSIYSGETFVTASFSYVLGFLIWTILEYVLHRKLFHFRPPENSETLIKLHFLIHGVHHKAPFDGRRLLFPPALGLLMAKVLWHSFEMIFPRSMIYFIAAGTTTGYICYDLMHYYLHHGAPTFGTYLYTMKRNHNYHHFLHHDRGFGISSELWDRVFQTDLSLRRLAKPIEW